MGFLLFFAVEQGNKCMCWQLSAALVHCPLFCKSMPQGSTGHYILAGLGCQWPMCGGVACRVDGLEERGVTKGDSQSMLMKEQLW